MKTTVERVMFDSLVVTCKLQFHSISNSTRNKTNNFKLPDKLKLIKEISYKVTKVYKVNR